MYVKCVLFVMYCAVHVTADQEYCRFIGPSNQYAYCTPSDVQRTFDYVPRIAHRIVYIKLSNQPLKHLPRNAFGNVTTQNELDSIHLFNCQIQHVDADAFEHLDSLEYLELAGNSISRLETGTFRHTKKLLRLFMGVNSVETLQAGLFHNLIYLREVSLKNNTITRIDQDTFRNTPSLRQINLDSNSLECLSPSFTDSFRNISNLYVADNPWNCDCTMREFYEKNQARKSRYAEPKLICQHPPGLRGRELSDMTRDSFRCDAQIVFPTNDTTVVSLGSNVTLSCAVFAVPVPGIEWRRSSNIIVRNDVFASTDATMHYLNYTFTVHEQDLGEYLCSAYNTDEIERSSTTLTLDDTTQ